MDDADTHLAFDAAYQIAVDNLAVGMRATSVKRLYFTPDAPYIL